MSLLYWFESIRTPALTVFFSLVTYLGHEIIPIGVICILYWCIDKKLAYKIGFSFFASGLTLQALKITFRIDRPWILDPNFKPVESALPAATGYSFPSGHTQSAVSLFSSLAIHIKKLWGRILCIAAFLLVGISRMYLGVHTPLDVFVSMAMTLVITVIVYFLIERIYGSRKYDTAVSALTLVLSAAVIVYAFLLLKSGVIEHKYASDALKAGGAGIGFAFGFFIERKYVNFDTASSLPVQFIKSAVGIILALCLKSGLKLIFGNNLVCDILRYFIAVIFILCVYPAIFKAILKKKVRN